MSCRKKSASMCLDCIKYSQLFSKAIKSQAAKSIAKAC